LSFSQIFCIWNLASNKTKLIFQLGKEEKKNWILKNIQVSSKKFDPSKFADFALLPPCVVK